MTRSGVRVSRVRDPEGYRFVSLRQYGRSKWASSRGFGLDVRIGKRFYVFIDVGRILGPWEDKS